MVLIWETDSSMISMQAHRNDLFRRFLLVRSKGQLRRLLELMHKIKEIPNLEAIWRPGIQIA